MHILLTNDDGIYAPGLEAMEKELRKIGDVSLVAPATEQSGVSHSITFLSPLVCKAVYDGERHRGWAVEGSPADCVKLAITELCSEPPDLVVSGINGGLNAGINVLYSGTVAAAIEGAFFGIESIAVSLEYDPHAQFKKAAKIARSVIEQLVTHRGEKPKLYNLNIPSVAIENESRLQIVPMGLDRYGENYEKRVDPRGRDYFWATNLPAPQPGIEETDLTALARGNVTLTALNYDMTSRETLEEMGRWSLELKQTIS